jgi:hypothetical protein
MKYLITFLLFSVFLPYKSLSQNRPKFEDLFYILNNLNFGDADIYFARKGFK